MKKLYLIYFLTAFFLFKPYQVNHHGMLYGGDDTQYLAFATSFAFGQFPSFDKEYVDGFTVPPPSRVGGGIFFAPLVTLFSVFDRFEGHAITQVRSRESLVGSWSLFGAFFSTALCFWFTLVFLYCGLRINFTERVTLFSIFAMVVAQGCALYAFRRPLMANAALLLVLSGFLFVLMRKLSDGVFRNRLQQIFVSPVLILLTASTFLLREEGRLFGLAWMTAILWPNLKAMASTSISAFAIWWMIKAFAVLGHPEAFSQVAAKMDISGSLTKFYGFEFYLKRLATLFFGMDWGLVFTSPMLVLALFGLRSKQWQRDSYFSYLSLSLIPIVYIVLTWNGQGGWYGYRYLVFPAIPVLIIPFARLVEGASRRQFIALCMLTLVPLFSMLVFEHSPAVGLHIVTNEAGLGSWGNLDYQTEVWKLVVTQPREFLYAILKTGPAYVVYVGASLFGLYDRLPGKFLELYGKFDWALFVKTLLIYTAPLFALASVALGKSIWQLVCVWSIKLRRKVPA